MFWPYPQVKKLSFQHGINSFAITNEVFYIYFFLLCSTVWVHFTFISDWPQSNCTKATCGDHPGQCQHGKSPSSTCNLWHYPKTPLQLHGFSQVFPDGSSAHTQKKSYLLPGGSEDKNLTASNC